MDLRRKPASLLDSQVSVRESCCSRSTTLEMTDTNKHRGAGKLSGKIRSFPRTPFSPVPYCLLNPSPHDAGLTGFSQSSLLWWCLECPLMRGIVVIRHRHVRKSRCLQKCLYVLYDLNHACVTLHLPFLVRHPLPSFLSTLQSSLQRYTFSSLQPFTLRSSPAAASGSVRQKPERSGW